MEFKKIQFNDNNAQKVYDNYIKQILSVTKTLNKEDQNDILMELNSHIYESKTKNNDESQEINNLLNTLERMGIPSEVLKPLIAEKKLNQATKTFNPIHVFQALVMNFSFGIIYIVFAMLYSFLFLFFILFIAKIFNPENVGLFNKNGEWSGGYITEPNIHQYDVLGNWFFPLIISIAIIFYILITLLLRLKSMILKNRNS